MEPCTRVSRPCTRAYGEFKLAWIPRLHKAWAPFQEQKPQHDQMGERKTEGEEAPRDDAQQHRDWVPETWDERWDDYGWKDEWRNDGWRNDGWWDDGWRDDGWRDDGWRDEWFYVQPGRAVVDGFCMPQQQKIINIMSFFHFCQGLAPSKASKASLETVVPVCMTWLFKFAICSCVFFCDLPARIQLQLHSWPKE